MTERLFVDDPSDSFKCPNTKCKIVMVQSVTVQCGHSFCKYCAPQIDKCPIDNKRIDKKLQFPNLVLENQLQEMIVHCRNGTKRDQQTGLLIVDSNGCNFTSELKSIEQHERSCMFNAVECKCKEFVQMRYMEEHQRQCPQMRKYNGNFIPEHPNDIRIKKQIARTSDPLKENEFQRIADNLTLRMMRLETQMNGSFQQMENMFYQIHTTMNLIVTHLNIVKSQPNQTEDVQSNYSSSTKLYDEFQRIMPDNAKALYVPNIKGISSTTSSNAHLYHTSHWMCPFSVLNAGILKAHRDVISCTIAFESLIITGSRDTFLKVWEISSLLQGNFGKTFSCGGCLATLEGHTKPISCIAVSILSKEIISVDSSSHLKVWNIDQFCLTREKQAIHEQETTGIAVSRISIFTGSYFEIKIWHLKTLTKLGCVNNEISHIVRCLLLEQPQERRLYSSGKNQILVWKICISEDKEKVNSSIVELNLEQTFVHSFNSANTMILSSRFIILGTFNQNVQFFNRTNGEHLFSLTGHISPINGLALTSTESHLVSAGADGCVNIWELERKVLYQTIKLDDDCSGQAVTIIGDVVFIAGSDGELKIYKYDKIR